MSILCHTAVPLTSSSIHTANALSCSLILTKPGYLIDATTTVLDSYGVPYDVLRVNTMTAAQLTDNYTYVKADGSASYSGIFMQVSKESGSNIWVLANAA